MIIEHSYGFVPVHRLADGDRFLLVRQTDGHWSFPKGHVEAGESPLAAARRELLEECGISAIRILPEYVFSESYTFTGREGVPVSKTNTLFLGFVSDAQVVPQESEVLEYRFVSLEESQSLDLFADTRRILSEAGSVLSSIPQVFEH